MKEQLASCEQLIADLARLFPEYPSDWFSTNAATVKLGGLLTITMPYPVARVLTGSLHEH